MILVWGFKSYVRLLGIVTFICGSCQNPAAQRVEERIRKFTFFWIPLFRVSRKTVVTCTFCGVGSVLNKEQAEILTAQMADTPPPAAPAQQSLASESSPSPTPSELPAAEN